MYHVLRVMSCRLTTQLHQPYTATWSSDTKGKTPFLSHGAINEISAKNYENQPSESELLSLPLPKHPTDVVYKYLYYVIENGTRFPFQLT